MRKDRKSNTKKERIIMLASSAFVLTALTMTGIYMQKDEQEKKDNGYTLDFTAIEDKAEKNSHVIDKLPTVPEVPVKTPPVIENDLDYMPLEAGSGKIEIPGLTMAQGENTLTAKEPEVQESYDTDRAKNDGEAAPEQTAAEQSLEEQTAAEVTEPEQADADPNGGEQADAGQTNAEQTNSEQVAVAGMNEPELHFAESDGLLRPLEGEALIPFSMDGSVYFSTLDQYKYNPALILAAQEGMSVFACAQGKVVAIYDDPEIGRALALDLGDGYRLLYGQLKGINVAPYSYVNPGDMIGTVAAPTKYYSVEGPNLYLQLTGRGGPVDPEALFR